MLFETIARSGQSVRILDQTRLPLEWQSVTLSTLGEMAQAIRSMQVRGAPLIGASAAYGIALSMQADSSNEALEKAIQTLAATRPTAVNLHWALDLMRHELVSIKPDARPAAAWAAAERIHAEDIAANAAIGQHGLTLLQTLGNKDHPLQSMTHCNAGALATCGWGTALAPIYAAHQAGIAQHVWVSETRPRNQGYLTAAELTANDIPHTLIADNAAGLILQQGKVDVVMTGADRIAANGDTANKVGTYLKALAAKAAGVPFYVAAPWSSIDLACASGAEIPIEERSGDELRLATGKYADGAQVSIACVDAKENVCNPAFDITPAALITGIITERGIFAPDQLRQNH